MKQNIDKVKRKLWMFGYSVKDYSKFNFVDFDLLVDNKFRVKVGTKTPRQKKDGYDIFVTVGDNIMFTAWDKDGMPLGVYSPYYVFNKPKNHAKNTKR